MMRFFSYFWPQAPLAMVYMLQQVEYHPLHFAQWLGRLPAMTSVMHRQRLVMTRKAQLLLAIAYGAWLGTLIFGALFIGRGELWGFAIALSAPFMSMLSLAIIATIAQKLIVNPTQAREITRARQKLAGMQAVRIAVIGSYGKTTMKDLLATVLSEGKKAVATPGNKNVLISHARWVNSQLDGDEEVLIFEYGEARPGDISRLADFSKPDFTVITGLAPAHLEDYGTLDAVAADFADVRTHVGPEKIYMNAESPELVTRMAGFHGYSIAGVDGWRTDRIDASLEGVSFRLQKTSRQLNLRTGLIGLHQVGPLSAVADIADKLGLSEKQIEDGVAQTKPYEHRMQPYRLGGAWIVDDTYNGNIEGAKAGLKLLQELEASGRKTYVTPGLVEQGDLKQSVHEELGRSIAIAAPDRVVLMRNSTTEYIQSGLDAGGYIGELIIENDPLNFYSNLEHLVAGGDIVLMQNDWTDNYL